MSSYSGYLLPAGYALSDRPYAYERFTNDHGTFKRDSILGLQMSAEFSPRLSATLQATVAPSTSDDHQWEPTLTWAFLSSRPTNDLLLRAGKLRMPMYLFSENMNIGASHDVMHMPTEVYSTAPTSDFSGASFSKSWGLSAGDLSVDGDWGVTQIKPRIEQNNEAQGGKLRTRSGGLVATWRQEENVYRAGVQQAYIAVGNPTPSFYEQGAAPMARTLPRPPAIKALKPMR